MLACFRIIASRSVAPASAEAIGFYGTITQVGDPANIFAGLPLPRGMVEGVFTLDPAAGTVSFDDGTTRQRLPTGTSNIVGTYRYGAGAKMCRRPASSGGVGCFNHLGREFSFRAPYDRLESGSTERVGDLLVG
jgi:hypothetical protein